MSIRNAAAVTVMAAAAIGAGATGATADQAHGSACKSPGVLAGNVAQVAPRVSPNVGGNAISVVGVLNSSQGNALINK
ncbi:chaplin [Streptomyces luteoverticillatus]|uniref:Chaplin n=1 Tax=Streptomyces luteoverticillatus TaxID=66425 RepID=A0A3Q9FS42_STRLT|nr:chaplin [Streptomyces luteoverticillatus]AZQ69994.1 chaplin [Streptomyces luteoverticillatus]